MCMFIGCVSCLDRHHCHSCCSLFSHSNSISPQTDCVCVYVILQMFLLFVYFIAIFCFIFNFDAFFHSFLQFLLPNVWLTFFSISILSVVPFTMPELFGVYTMDYLLLALPTIPNVFSCTATVPHSDSPFSQLWWLPPFQVCMLQFYISHSACLLFFFLFASSMSHEIHMVTISVAMQDNNSNNNKRGRARSHEPHRKQPSSTCLLNVWKRMWMQSIWCRVNGTNTHN